MAGAFHNDDMDDLAAPVPVPQTWRRRLVSPRSLMGMAVGLVIGCAVLGGVWRTYMRPQRETAQRRYDTTMDLWALYDLQMTHKLVLGTYANGLDALLATSRDGPALKARMAGHLDLNTVAVVGDAGKFRLEANVLDSERTLVKIKGPIMERMRPAAPAPTLPEASSSSSDMGAPIGR